MTRDEIIRESKQEGGMFIVIPSVVKLDTELPLSAQMLYGIITWKCNKGACTWATNRELGEDLGVSAKRVSALLALLEERGHIETEIEYKEGTKEILRRYIYPIMRSARGMERRDPPPKNEDTPPSKQAYLPSNAGGPSSENKKISPPIVPPTGDSAPAEAATEDKPAPEKKSRRFVPPDVEQVRAYCRERGNSIDPEAFVDYYASKGWTVGRAPMKDWRAAVRTWEQRRRSHRKEEAGEDDCFQ